MRIMNYAYHRIAIKYPRVTAFHFITQNLSKMGSFKKMLWLYSVMWQCHYNTPHWPLHLHFLSGSPHWLQTLRTPWPSSWSFCPLFWDWLLCLSTEEVNGWQHTVLTESIKKIFFPQNICKCINSPTLTVLWML